MKPMTSHQWLELANWGLLLGLNALSRWAMLSMNAQHDGGELIPVEWVSEWSA